MRELTANEIFEVGGAGPLDFTSSITWSLLNNISNANAVGKMVSVSFGAGYAIGSFLNAYFGISTWIVDRLTD